MHIDVQFACQVANVLETGHSIGVAGGTYGVSISGLFAAESMFHYVTDASKVAVAYLVQHLEQRGFFAVLGAGGVAGRGADALVFFRN